MRVPPTLVTVAAFPIAGAALPVKGRFRLAGAWELRADGRDFHSLSGLAFDPAGRLIAITDRGVMVTIPDPGQSGAAALAAIAWDGQGQRYGYDSEAIAIDAQDRRWIAIENDNAVLRLAHGSRPSRFIRSPAMRGWTAMRGPESLALLGDGRFLILGEGYEQGEGGTFPALVFPRDPTLGDRPWRFHLAMGQDYRPVEAASLADGRVLVLGRWFGLPFRFAAALFVFDMGAAKPGATIRAKPLGRIDGPGFSDNFEGMALREGPGDGLTIWLVSDSNEAQLLQRTLLLKLETRKSAL